MCKFTHLHNHSVYSKDGLGPVETMVSRVKELGMSSLALTDHGTLSGVVEFDMACEKYDIKPIYGIEGYISLNPGDDKIRVNHITILSTTKQGFSNLVELNNRSHTNMIKKGAIKFPLMSFKDMKELRSGLVVLTGCPASAIYDSDFDYAVHYVQKLVNIFGDEHVHPELMFVMEGHDYHSRPLQLAAELGLSPVITNDSHYTYAEDANIHMICTGIRSRAVSGSDYSYDNKELYIKSPDEMFNAGVKTIGKENTQWCFDTIESIVDSVEKIDLTHEVVVPFVSEEDLAEFRQLLISKLNLYKKRFPNSAELAQKRFDREVAVIDQYNFWSYFYIVNDITYYCTKNDRFATARGSAGGSFIIYLLNICQVDPLRYNLMFERFLNPARSDYPDIDLDVDSTFRSQLVEYCQNRWGLKPVNTTITFSHRSLVRDLASYITISEDVQWLQDIGEESDEFHTFLDNNPEFARAYELMLDQPKTVGTHAAAMASIENDLPIPVEQWGNDLGIAFSESGIRKVLSRIGGLKFDILGLNTLGRLYQMFKLSGVLPPEDIDAEFPSEIFCEGKTLGIFQFDGSAGIKQMCIDVQPKSLEELATINSMYRPGALDAGTAEHYMEYKLNPRKFHPKVDKILEPTYSVIVYQEQVMGIYAEVTGEGLEGADLARRILSPKSPKVRDDPKWKKEIKRVEKQFFTKGKENGYPEETLKALWSELITHSRYSFNKSHSISYAYIAAQQAWYKLHYPKIFYLATLSALLDDNKNDQMQDYIYLLSLEGIEVKPPCVVNSTQGFSLKDDELYLPITVVKHISERSVEALNFLKLYLENKHNEFDVSSSINGEVYYQSLLEKLIKNNVTELNTKSFALLSKGHVWNKRAKENMVMIGGFRNLPGDLTDLIDYGIMEEHNVTQSQIQAMDVTLVTPKMLKYKKHAEKNNQVFGIIVKKLRKQNRNGTPVVVLKLTNNLYVRLPESKEEYVESFVKLDVGTPIICSTNEWGYLLWNNKLPRIQYAY